MVDPDTYIIACEDPLRIIGAMNAVIPQLPREVRQKLNTIKLHYLQSYGEVGLFERVTNRSISAVIADYDWGNRPKPIASGERDGVRYELYDYKQPENEQDSR